MVDILPGPFFKQGLSHRIHRSIFNFLDPWLLYCACNSSLILCLNLAGTKPYRQLPFYLDTRICVTDYSSLPRLLFLFSFSPAYFNQPFVGGASTVTI